MATIAEMIKKFKLLPENFLELAEGKTTEELKNDIVTCERAISEQEKLMEADDALTAMKEELKIKMGDYKEPIKGMNQRIRVIVAILEDRGTP